MKYCGHCDYRWRRPRPYITCPKCGHEGPHFGADTTPEGREQERQLNPERWLKDAVRKKTPTEEAPVPAEAFLVPFDGSLLSERALLRAQELNPDSHPIIGITIIPLNNTEYARTKGWIEPSEVFVLDTIVSRLRSRVHDLVPGAKYRYETVDRYTPQGALAKPIRKLARRAKPSLLIIGSNNAGRTVTSVTSFGGQISNEKFDILLVRSSLE